MKFADLGRALARRGAWALAVIALVVVLALSACGGHGPTNPTAQEATATATLPPVQQVVQTDANFDAVIAAIDSASIDANIDESAKDNIAVP